jgi:hypothetical protein
MIKKTLKTAKRTASLFVAVTNAFNPFYYSDVIGKPLKEVTSHLLYLLLLIMILTAALILPSIGSPLLTDNFSKLTISTDIETKEPIESEITWLGNLDVLINTSVSESTASDYDIVLTNNELKTKSLICLFRTEICRLFGTSHQDIPINKIDLVNDNSNIVPLFFWLMLPGLIMLLYVSLVVKYAALILVVSILGFLLVKVVKKSTGYIDILKIAAFAATTLIVLDFITFLMSFGFVKVPVFVPLIFYAFFVGSAVLLNENKLQGNIV